MRWKASSVMEEKARFVLEYERDEQSLRGLCEPFGIARETGYVWPFITSCENPLPYLAGSTNRLYFRSTCCSCAWGMASTSKSLIPFMVLAAIRALTTASSTLWTVARNSGFMSSLGTMASCFALPPPHAPGLALENAMKMSPEPSPE